LGDRPIGFTLFGQRIRKNHFLIFRRIIHESKEPDAFASGSLLYLAQNCDVRCLRTLGTFFDNEFNLLAFGQIFETVTLNGREMDKHVRSTFTLDKAEAFVTIEPLYCTSYTIRHFLPPYGN